MISVPRKPSRVFIWKTLTLGIENESIKTKQGLLFQRGQLSKAVTGLVKSFCGLRISQRLHLKELSDIRDSSSLLCSWSECGGWGDICQHERAEQCGNMMPTDGFTARRSALSHPLLPSLCQTPSSTQTHSPAPAHLPASAPDIYLRLRSLADGHPANCTATMPWWHRHLQRSPFVAPPTPFPKCLVSTNIADLPCMSSA